MNAVTNEEGGASSSSEEPRSLQQTNPITVTTTTTTTNRLSSSPNTTTNNINTTTTTTNNSNNESINRVITPSSGLSQINTTQQQPLEWNTPEELSSTPIWNHDLIHTFGTNNNQASNTSNLSTASLLSTTNDDDDDDDDDDDINSNHHHYNTNSVQDSRYTDWDKTHSATIDEGFSSTTPTSSRGNNIMKRTTNSIIAEYLKDPIPIVHHSCHDYNQLLEDDENEDHFHHAWSQQQQQQQQHYYYSNTNHHYNNANASFTSDVGTNSSYSTFWQQSSHNPTSTTISSTTPVPPPPPPPPPPPQCQQGENSYQHVDRGRCVWSRDNGVKVVRTYTKWKQMWNNKKRKSNKKQETMVERKPVLLHSLLARECTGKLVGGSIASSTGGGTRRGRNGGVFPLTRLQKMGGMSIYQRLNIYSDQMCELTQKLNSAIDHGQWEQVSALVEKIAPRLIGDTHTISTTNTSSGSSSSASSSLGRNHRNSSNTTNSNHHHHHQDLLNDDTTQPNLSPTAKLQLERDVFVLNGGVHLLTRIFREPSFVGTSVQQYNDARLLDNKLVDKYCHTWKLILESLRELAFGIPSLVMEEDSDLLDGGTFLPFLFTMLAHSACFDTVAALIEEILSLQSQCVMISHGSSSSSGNGGGGLNEEETTSFDVFAHSYPSTFFLGEVPDLYELWSTFTCSQLAQFSRILALLVFEPEDRHHNGVLKSIDLLQMRRDRSARAGADSIVEKNQALIIGDPVLMNHLLQLLRIFNYAPDLNRKKSYQVLAHFPRFGEFLEMIGLREIEDWEDVDRLERIVEGMRLPSNGEDGHPNRASTGTSGNENIRHSCNRIPNDEYGYQRLSTSKLRRSELGTISVMLESLSELFLENDSGTVPLLGHFERIMNAARNAGVPPQQQRQHSITSPRMNRRVQRTPSDVSAADLSLLDTSTDTWQSNEGMEQRSPNFTIDPHSRGMAQATNFDNPYRSNYRHSHQMQMLPKDAANKLQFSALKMMSYQVEILFVLCTLLGGSRKVDAQRILSKMDLIQILEDMFERLSWGIHGKPSSTDTSEEEEEADIFGPSGECKPEYAVRVQYLRLLHNFCDRDTENYSGRKFLLSTSERNFIYGDNEDLKFESGLLSKVICAFCSEHQDSPYRFWLASCIESWLRGSSPREQVFCARSGLLCYLLDFVLSDQLHCTGSLQSAFDILGELCKGNMEALHLCLSFLHEQEFQKLMRIAVLHLVDSNVFIRSLLLSIEQLRVERTEKMRSLSRRDGQMISFESISSTPASTGYLTHSWGNTTAYSERKEGSTIPFSYDDNAKQIDHTDQTSSRIKAFISKAWIFSMEDSDVVNSMNNMKINEGGIQPFITTERLSCFLQINQACLLRDLLESVNLFNINHENICCLNTAIIISIFAYRRKQLPIVINQLRSMKRKRVDSFKQSPSQEPVDILVNYRQLLWFWSEYYFNRGRDRLSLEFSSHITFREWKHVVCLLCADDGTDTSLMPRPIKMPTSPYSQTPKSAYNEYSSRNGIKSC